MENSSALGLRPIHDTVWIDPEPPEEYHKFKQYEHIVVPDKYEHGPEDRPVWGRVIAMGPEVKTPGVQVGARVVFGKWAPARIRYQEKEYMLVREDDLLAVDDQARDLI